MPHLSISLLKIKYTYWSSPLHRWMETREGRADIHLPVLCFLIHLSVWLWMPKIRPGYSYPHDLSDCFSSSNFYSFLELLLDVHWLFWIYFLCHSYFFLLSTFQYSRCMFNRYDALPNLSILILIFLLFLTSTPLLQV